MKQEQLEFSFMGTIPFKEQDLSFLVDHLHAKEDSMLFLKGKEYTSGEDRLENFRTISYLLKIPMELVCGVFLLKHVLSLIGYTIHGREPSTESLEDKIIDARNYLMFLLAIIKNNEMTQKEKDVTRGTVK